MIILVEKLQLIKLIEKKRSGRRVGRKEIVKDKNEQIKMSKMDMRYWKSTVKISNPK